MKHILTFEHIRNSYKKYGSSDNYYKSKKHDYINPHLDRIKNCLDLTISQIEIGNFLDLGCGNGEITEYLISRGYSQYKGCDPYFSEIYKDKIGADCLNLSFEDIAKKGLNEKFDTIFCSYSLHLCDKSYFNNLLYQLSICCKNLVVISPSKYPDISTNYFKLKYSNIYNRTHLRIYKSNN